MKKAFSLFVGLALALAVSNNALATVPELIPVGGVLTDLDGIPLEGYYDVTFSLYETATGGTALWSETYDGADQLDVVDGVFTAYLGEIDPLNLLDLIEAENLWLGIQVGADSEMNRIPVGAVPFAVEARVCRQVVAECDPGEFIRGWDYESGEPICEPDQIGEVGDAGVATQTWVENQGYATESWVEGQAYAAGDHTHADMATQTWVASQGYATQVWVNGQGYATQSWVEGRGYATESWVTGRGYATETWVGDQLNLYQLDVENMSCQFGIASIDDTGAVDCADDPGGSSLSPDDISTVSNGIINNVLDRTNNSTDTPLAIPTSPTGISSTIYFPSSGEIRSITVTVDITHPDISELTVRLFSPDATQVTLHNQSDPGTANMSFTYPDDRAPAIGSMDDYIGEQMQGTWTLLIIDNTSGNNGTLNAWSLNFEYLSDAQVAVSGDLLVEGSIYQGGVTVMDTVYNSIMPTILKQEIELVKNQASSSVHVNAHDDIVADIYTHYDGYNSTTSYADSTASHVSGYYYAPISTGSVLADDPEEIVTSYSDSWVTVASYELASYIYRFASDGMWEDCTSNIAYRTVWNYADSSIETGSTQYVGGSYFHDLDWDNPSPAKIVNEVSLEVRPNNGASCKGHSINRKIYSNVIGDHVQIQINLPEELNGEQAIMVSLWQEKTICFSVSYSLQDSEGGLATGLPFDSIVHFSDIPEIDNTKLSSGFLYIDLVSMLCAVSPRIKGFAYKIW